jgi:hypothetical protein
MATKLYVWGNHYSSTSGFQENFTTYTKQLTKLELPIFHYASQINLQEIQLLIEKLVDEPAILIILIGNLEIDDNTPLSSLISLFDQLYDKLIRFHHIQVVTCGFIKGKQSSVFRQSRFYEAELRLLSISNVAGTHLFLDKILTSADFNDDNSFNLQGEQKLALTIIRHILCYYPEYIK